MDEILNCSNCGVSFEAKRASAKFCSEACKQKNKRKVSVSETLIVSPVSVSSASPEVIVSHKGLCHQAKDCNHSHADRITFIPNWIRLENPSKDLEALVDIVRKKLNAVTS